MAVACFCLLAVPLCFPQVLFTTHSRPFGQAYGREQDLREAKLLWLFVLPLAAFGFLRERRGASSRFLP
jgi:hypothetical protein